MSLRARMLKRGTLLALTFGFLTFALVACSVGPAAVNQQTQAYPFSTPNPLLFTPTPTFPPFTVGAWPSNYSPNNADTVTIYVVCRAQPAAMTGPSQPTSGLAVQVDANAINQHASGTTGNDGMAAIPLTFTDPNSGTPVVVNITVQYRGVTYTAQTFFTPNPSATPTPTPNPNATKTPTATGTTGAGTPTPTP